MSSEFEQLCDQALAIAGDVSSAQRERIIADLRLRFEHPSEYAAYIDEYPVVVGNTRHLVRTVVAADPDLRVVHRALADLSKEAQQTAVIDFVDPLTGDLMVPHNLSER